MSYAEDLANLGRWVDGLTERVEILEGRRPPALVEELSQLRKKNEGLKSKLITAEVTADGFKRIHEREHAELESLKEDLAHERNENGRRAVRLREIRKRVRAVRGGWDSLQAIAVIEKILRGELDG